MLKYIDDLLKHTNSTLDEIKDCLLLNDTIVNDNFLLCYNIREESCGRVMYVLFAAGDGKKAYSRFMSIAKRKKCNRIYCVTNRPKGMERKYGFKPIGTLMEIEVE